MMRAMDSGENYSSLTYHRKKTSSTSIENVTEKKFFIGKKEANSCPREQGHELLYWP